MDYMAIIFNVVSSEAGGNKGASKVRRGKKSQFGHAVQQKPKKVFIL